MMSRAKFHNHISKLHLPLVEATVFFCFSKFAFQQEAAIKTTTSKNDRQSKIFDFCSPCHQKGTKLKPWQPGARNIGG
jgi:hypothetical protein